MYAFDLEQPCKLNSLFAKLNWKSPLRIIFFGLLKQTYNFTDFIKH